MQSKKSQGTHTSFLFPPTPNVRSCTSFISQIHRVCMDVITGLASASFPGTSQGVVAERLMISLENQHAFRFASQLRTISENTHPSTDCRETSPFCFVFTMQSPIHLSESQGDYPYSPQAFNLLASRLQIIPVRVFPRSTHRPTSVPSLIR
jgi:hypothetical protein